MEPVVSPDLDLIVAADPLGEAQVHLAREFRPERFARSLDVR